LLKFANLFVVPPTVRSEPGHITITKGDSVTLQCRGTGNPVPTITWTRRVSRKRPTFHCAFLTVTSDRFIVAFCQNCGKKNLKFLVNISQNDALPNGEQSADGNNYAIQKADRHSAGVYICTANNEVGTPVTTNVEVKVQCKFPIIYFAPVYTCYILLVV